MSEKEFLEQVRQNQGIIYKLVSLYAATGEEKKDLYQEILLQAWKGYEGFRKEAKFSSWLYRVSLNTILTQKRKVSRVAYQASIDNLADQFAAEGVDKDAGTLRFAIRQLAETDRAIISMHLDGYDNGEIAAVIGISNNHVAVKLHRIKQQLAEFLKREQ